MNAEINAIALRKFRNNFCVSSRIIYQRVNANLRKTLKTGELFLWHNFCNNFNRTSRLN